MTARRCTGTTKKGKPCKAHPLEDRDVCLAHADEETRASVGFTGEAGKLGGRPPAPKVIDVLRERVEERVDALVDTLFAAMEADRGLVVGNGAHASVELVVDHPTRVAAVRELLDRAYGRPKQTQELTGPDGAAIELQAPTDLGDRSARAAKLLAEHGLVPVGASGNGSSNGHH